MLATIPIFQERNEILYAAKAGKMDVVLITNIDQISRDTFAVDSYIGQLKETRFD